MTKRRASDTPADRALKRAAIGDLRYSLPMMSQRALVAICEWSQRYGGLPDVRSTKEVRRARADASTNIATPYGQLTQSHVFDGVSVEMVNPWSLIYHVMGTSSAFSELVLKVVVDGVLTLILYCDEVTPGNQMLHKNPRKVQTIYFSFEEFGPALSNEELWLPGTVFASDKVAQIDGGWSRVIGHFVKLFFNTDPARNLTITGINVKLHRTGERFHLFAKFGDSLMDELAASNQVFNAKGASGLKCCKWCCNVFNAKTSRTCVHSNSWAVLHDESDAKRFVMHTPETYAKVAADLTAASTAMSSENFKELQTALGFNYNPGGILQDDDLMSIMEPSKHSIADWMHVLLVNGVLDVSFGQFMKAMKTTSFTFASARAFCGLWSWPKILGGHNGLRTLSESRAKVTLESGVFKAEASDARSIMPVIAYLLRETLNTTSCAFTDRQKAMCQCALHLMGVLYELECSMRSTCNLEKLEYHARMHMSEFVRPTFDHQKAGEGGIGAYSGLSCLAMVDVWVGAWGLGGSGWGRGCTATRM